MFPSNQQEHLNEAEGLPEVFQGHTRNNECQRHAQLLHRKCKQTAPSAATKAVGVDLTVDGDPCAPATFERFPTLKSHSHTMLQIHTHTHGHR